MPSDLATLVIAALFVAGWVLAYWFIYRPRPSDVAAINAWASENKLRVISINHSWRQSAWKRRFFSLSTFARFYRVVAAQPEGADNRTIDVAFDPLRPDELKVLDENELRRRWEQGRS
jgi:hypothetical protein